ncbi:TauD/TfdA family dioxygenase (plasmid) [Sinorhizobium meliloti]|uniref:TauD/TfdA family dioxygenase n=1 Tax=Rhizobium meliloti TaxID=382 RepID=UPI000B4A129B|nr:TauD/TfdA family dioxygenase [Sinorhizobium meliloti]ASP76473.1 TauD/TfdA family dioxygenase [Sinorhizobium meliloti]MDE3856961.1 TauD/TfdA family dioxygenase [Sinorhizobium meliloti]MQW48033.1 TauD/TfdA family dioxygenase [Sinorhizobium meliloti]
MTFRLLADTDSTTQILDGVQVNLPNRLGVLPAILRAERSSVSLHQWLTSHRDFVRDALHKVGAVLFRGFKVDTPDRLRAVSVAYGDLPRPYLERRTPRSDLGAGVFTSTIHPKDQIIHFHNELSFSHEWPERLWFCCIQPAESGGQTPLADSRSVLQVLCSDTRAAFQSKGVLYLRNFHPGLGLSWQETFQTENPDDVDEFCARADIKTEWRSGGEHLKTWQRRPAIVTHPITGEAVFFNQAHHFHPRTLPAKVERLLRAQHSEEDMPRHAFFGDRSTIPDEIIDEIVEAYESSAVSFDWEAGDVVALDNLLVAHARAAYTGERVIGLVLGGIGFAVDSTGGVGRAVSG